MQFRLRTLLTVMVASALWFWLSFAADYWLALPLLGLGAAPQLAAIAVTLFAGQGDRRAFAVGAASVAWLPVLLLIAYTLLAGCYLGGFLVMVWQETGAAFDWEELWIQLNEPLEGDAAWYEGVCRSFLAGNFVLAGTSGLVAVVLQRSLTTGEGSPRRPWLMALLLIGGYFAVPVVTWASFVYLGQEYGAGFLWAACLLTYPLSVALTLYGRGVWRASGIALAATTYATLAGNLILSLSCPLWMDALGFDIEYEDMPLIILGVFAAKWLAIGLGLCGGLAAWWAAGASVASTAAALQTSASEAPTEAVPAPAAVVPSAAPLP